MPFLKVSWLFDATTTPTQSADASAHSGGWSESHWAVPFEIIPGNAVWTWAQKRAQMLPRQASIVGYRAELFTIDGNGLLPGGTSGGRFLFPGNPTYTLGLPQDALTESATASGGINTAKFSLRALPDEVCAQGEYQPTSAFRSALADFNQYLVINGWGMMARVRSAPTARILFITGGQVALSANVGGVAPGSYLRLLRAYDDDGNPLKGAYRITAIAGSIYTVEGLAGLTTTFPRGTARIDSINFYRYAGVTPQRAAVRKIGRPFEQYRGRASRVRA